MTITDINSKVLTDLTSNVSPGLEGILTCQERRLPLEAALKRCFTKAKPISQAIAQMALKAGVDGVTLLTTGTSSSIPWGALPGNSSGTPLGELLEIAVTPFSTWRSEVPVTSISSASFIAVPNSNAGPLSGVEREVSIAAATVSRLSPTPTAKILKGAEKADLLNAFEAGGVVHVASHSGHNTVNPFDSRILLAGSDISAEEILGLDASGLELAVLSSCESGKASPFTLPDDIVSLQSTLIYAGCRRVIGSLWPVADTATLLFMARFYRELINTGTFSTSSIRRALSSTAKWLREARNSELKEFARTQNMLPHEAVGLFSSRGSSDERLYASPEYWAAFSLMIRDLPGGIAVSSSRVKIPHRCSSVEPPRTLRNKLGLKTAGCVQDTTGPWATPTCSGGLTTAHSPRLSWRTLDGYTCKHRSSTHLDTRRKGDDDPMSRSKNVCRLFLQTRDGRTRSSVWRIWSGKDGADIYISPSRLAGQFKLSIHRDGMNQIGYYGTIRDQIRAADKHFLSRWRREEVPFITHGWTTVCALIFNSSEFESVHLNERAQNKAQVFNAPPADFDVVVFVLTTEDRENSGEISSTVIAEFPRGELGGVIIAAAVIPHEPSVLAAIDSDRRGFGWEAPGHRESDEPYGFICAIGPFPSFAEYSSRRHPPPPLVSNLPGLMGKARPWSDAPAEYSTYDAFCGVVACDDDSATLYIDARAHCNHNHLVADANDLITAARLGKIDSGWSRLADGRIATGITMPGTADAAGLNGYLPNPMK